MLYRSNFQASKELLKQPEINDEFLFRELARKMVSEMSYEGLKKLFYLQKDDPSSVENIKLLSENLQKKDPKYYEQQYIKSLKEQEVVVFTVKCHLP